MRESVEFRIPEENARTLLTPDQGKSLGGTVRALVVDVTDPLYERIGHIHRQMRRAGKYFYYGWSIRRQYSTQELRDARLLHLKITSAFEPAGEECGTVYDDRAACPHCGAGRRQVSDLILDLRKAPRTRDIARTIADEWIISQRLAERLVEAEISGFDLRPVRHKARFQDDAILPGDYPSGRVLLARAEAAGAAYPGWRFWVWLNRPAQEELRRQMREEHVRAMEGRAARHPGAAMPSWYQLVVTSPRARMVAPTRFGNAPFDESDEYRCPLGHVAGLNVLSEIWIDPATWEGSDIVCTEPMVGVRRGLLVPSPRLLISPRLWRLLEAERIKGFEVEVVHFI